MTSQVKIGNSGRYLYTIHKKPNNNYLVSNIFKKPCQKNSNNEITSVIAFSHYKDALKIAYMFDKSNIIFNDDRTISIIKQTIPEYLFYETNMKNVYKLNEKINIPKEFPSEIELKNLYIEKADFYDLINKITKNYINLLVCSDDYYNNFEYLIKIFNPSESPSNYINIFNNIIEP
jgi:hypothetical protein